MKHTHKLMCGLLAATLSMPFAGAANPVLLRDDTPSQVYATAHFSDLSEEHWAYSYIMELLSGGGIDGMGDGTFRPDALVTREQFAKMLLPCLGLDIEPDGHTASQLADVSADRWSAPFISTMLTCKIYDATANGNQFHPAQKLTRGVAAEWIINSLKPEYSKELRVPSGSKFSDVPTGSPQSEKINIAAESGIITGYADHTFRPNNTITRAEAAVMLVRLCNFTKWAWDIREYPSYIDQDILPQLSEQERKELFTQFVCPLTAHSISDPEDVAQDTSWISMEYTLPLENFGGIEQTINGIHYSVFLESEFDRLVQLLFGKSYDLSKYACSSLPASKADNAQVGYLMNGKFYLGYNVAMETDGMSVYKPRLLLSLGGNRYFAKYERWHEGLLSRYTGEYAAIIEKLPSGEWTIVARYPANQMPTEEELSAFGVPQAD